MKIVKKAEDAERREVVVTLGHVGTDIVSVQDKNEGEFMVLYETSTGMPSARVIYGLRRLADEMEKGMAGVVSQLPGVRA